MPSFYFNYSTDFLVISKSKEFCFKFLTDLADCDISENEVLLMYTLEGVNSVANIITAYEESQKYWDVYFLISIVFFVSKGNLLDVRFTTEQR